MQKIYTRAMSLLHEMIDVMSHQSKMVVKQVFHLPDVSTMVSILPGLYFHCLNDVRTRSRIRMVEICRFISWWLRNMNQYNGPETKRPNILLIIFLNVLSGNNFFLFLTKVLLKFVPRGPIDDRSVVHVLHVMACCLFSTKQLPKPILTCWPKGTKFQWNSHQ